MDNREEDIGEEKKKRPPPLKELFKITDSLDDEESNFDIYN
jgi:hypothetical protein